MKLASIQYSPLFSPSQTLHWTQFSVFFFDFILLCESKSESFMIESSRNWREKFNNFFFLFLESIEFEMQPCVIHIQSWWQRGLENRFYWKRIQWNWFTQFCLHFVAILKGSKPTIIKRKIYFVCSMKIIISAEIFVPRCSFFLHSADMFSIHWLNCFHGFMFRYQRCRYFKIFQLNA